MYYGKELSDRITSLRKSSREVFGNHHTEAFISQVAAGHDLCLGDHDLQEMLRNMSIKWSAGNATLVYDAAGTYFWRWMTSRALDMWESIETGEKS